MSDLTITDSVVIHAKPETVYDALVRPMHLNQWFCNHSDVHYRAAENSYFYLGWNADYQVTGKFVALEANKRVVMEWRGAGEPLTRVEYALTPEGEDTRVTMTHTGYGDSDADRQMRENHLRGWEGMLEGLKYYVETGLDQRVMRRPMLGVLIGNFTPEVAERLGVPVTKGVLIDGTLEGMSARKAGITRGDVITSVNNTPVAAFQDIGAALRGKVGGDQVPVTYYRGGEKFDAIMELTQRPTPEIEATPAELAAHTLERYDTLMGELEALVKDIPESVLSAAPAEGEWSVNQNFAHLIWTERHLQMVLWNDYGGGFGVDWPDNGPLHLAGVLAVYPTNADLVAELKRSFTATIAIIKTLMPEDGERKPVYVRMVQGVHGNCDHVREHIEQITTTIQQVQANTNPAVA